MATPLSAEEIHQKAREAAAAQQQVTIVPPTTATTAAKTTEDSAGGAFTDRHTKADGTEDLTLILADEQNAEKNLAEILIKHNSDYTQIPVIQASLRMLESWIGLYKLKPMDELLAKLLPAVELMKKKYDTLLLQYDEIDAKKSLKKKKPTSTTTTTSENDTTPSKSDDNKQEEDKKGPEEEEGDLMTELNKSLLGGDSDDDSDNAEGGAADLDDNGDGDDEKYNTIRYCKDYNDLYLRTIQLKAFMKYKQHDFAQALDLFEQFRGLTGDSPELLENMGHTYNVLGKDEKAVECFKSAIHMREEELELKRGQIRSVLIIERARNKALLDKMSAEELKKYDEDQAEIEMAALSTITMTMGGLLLGLGTSYKRQGKYQEALVYIVKALQLYQARYNGNDHSLVAKTLTALADCYFKLHLYSESLQSHLEAVRIFKATCGVSPLTANALFGLAECYQFLTQFVMLDDNVLEMLEEKQKAARDLHYKMMEADASTKKSREQDDEQEKIEKKMDTKQDKPTTTNQKKPELTPEQLRQKQNDRILKQYVYQVYCVQALDESFTLHCGFDTPDLLQIIRVVQAILDNKTQLIGKPYPTPQSPPLALNDAMRGYFKPIATLQKTFEELGMSDMTDDRAVLNKSFGEIMLLAGDYEAGIKCLLRAIAHFETVTEIDCSGLIQTCQNLIKTAISLMQKPSAAAQPEQSKK